ncbi:MAG: hypothetical protein PHD00_03895 [Bacteroidales bacterium]|nr:hypothetical protein [Bacteroidales bacterium]MDD4672313.1 hypothetical protein [Bacteroidales bacterium]MDY0349014.1 hypothetical protein [Tenuifilaceae bacterium]
MELDILLTPENEPTYTAVETQKPKPVPVAEKKPAQIPKTSHKSISIKQAIEGKTIEENTPTESVVDDEEQLDKNDELAEVEMDDSTVNQQDIDKFWQKFIDIHLSEKPGYASMLTSYSPVLTANNLIKVVLESQLQADMFNEIKNDLSVFLRRKLGCKSIELSCKVMEDNSGSTKMYTSEDKLKFLSQQNPNILDLMKQLNLDFD